ncbi:MAG: alpha/beta hydrolase [Sphingobium sp.]
MSFEGFTLEDIQLGDVRLRVRHGGSGPPLLLLHGCPQTHMMWGKIAGDLARDFTVVAPDLRGYGRSSKPVAGDRQANYAKRAMAGDALALMTHLGFPTLAVAGHDRGGRVAYRMALDHPERVTRLSILDIVPTGEVWARADHRMMLGYWHWAFLAQPAPFPERAIGATGAEAFFFEGMFRGSRAIFDDDAYADYAACLADPETVRGICEDYRAGAGIDRRLDWDQRGIATIKCPVQILWGNLGAVGNWYDVLDLWSVWAPDLSGHGLDCGHFIPEEKPAETLAAFREFFGEG